LELNGTQQFLGCADDDNLLSENKSIIKHDTQALLDANMEVIPEAKA
jgi:hypothetical protein